SLFLGVEFDIYFNVVSRLGSFIGIIIALTGEAPEDVTVTGQVCRTVNQQEKKDSLW
ncbi:12460_t:CDS:2, partial [Funneliformis geosporum]